ncbi:hypothetical protein QUF31_20185 [Dickeya chrysanthemi]|uniref:hypothetical protein n=1 Tax=Dickeya chrysanthemi TaxID=556 RepID=UPI0025A00133|nr:hypothetical protein [Dickeya chrysanthemi]WJM85370.1 hypothetical protein QUF31_20185 [Dickeya chrysanthemi]
MLNTNIIDDKTLKYMTASMHIDHVIELSLLAGNEIKEYVYGWVNIDCVVFFCEKMTQDLRIRIQKEEPTLRYFSTNKTPHNQAEEGFICDVYNIAVSYPK